MIIIYLDWLMRFNESGMNNTAILRYGERATSIPKDINLEIKHWIKNTLTNLGDIWYITFVDCGTIDRVGFKKQEDLNLFRLTFEGRLIIWID